MVRRARDKSKGEVVSRRHEGKGYEKKVVKIGGVAKNGYEGLRLRLR
jgi:hypothetical protein